MKKKYAFLTTFLFIYLLSFSQQMPLDFSDSADNFSVFGGSSFSTRNDPKDNSNTVAQFHNNGSNANQGFYIDLSKSIDIGAQKKITLSFYSFDPNPHNILLKLENGSNPNVEVKETFNVQSPSDWKTITFDFSGKTGTYNRLTILIDEGTTTAGTYLIDNINDGSAQTDPNEIDVIYTDLVWADEFDGSALDTSKWFHQTFGPNGGRWYNGELQHYTNNDTNSFVSDGNLNIVAKKETITQNGVTLDYTSARLNSKYAFTYGRVDVRAKLPLGNGTWPAIWTLGKNISEEGAYFQTQGFGTTNWPACGEIDIMEHGLHATNSVSSALHTPDSYGNTMNTATKALHNVSENFHVYSMNWSPNQITFLIDYVGYYTFNPSTKNSSTWPFDLEQFLLLNVAMGGFSGNPDANFTQSSMVIDYVRVYQNKNLGLESVFSSKFSTYPNPSSDYLDIKTNESIDKIEFYTTLGKLVIQEEKSIKKIDTRFLKPGLYLMKIYSDNKVVNKKVIIK